MFPGKDYERVAPEKCDDCGGTEFERRGRVGMWDGGRGSGYVYEAICLSCKAVWHSYSDPFMCRDNSQGLRWHSHRREEPGRKTS